jgi:hypothetical protein
LLCFQDMSELIRTGQWWFSIEPKWNYHMHRGIFLHSGHPSYFWCFFPNPFTFKLSGSGYPQLLLSDEFVQIKYFLSGWHLTSFLFLPTIFQSKDISSVTMVNPQVSRLNHVLHYQSSWVFASMQSSVPVKNSFPQRTLHNSPAHLLLTNRMLFYLFIE